MKLFLFKKSFNVAIMASLLVITSCATQPQSDFIPYYQAETTKPYSDVLAELKIAISENNFRITGHNRVGKVIRDRGTKDFPNYDSLQFCNLTHAKTLLELSPNSIRHIPCHVVVYEYLGKTRISTHLIPIDSDNIKLNEFAKKINITLRNIVDFAVE
jgi:uncharacterized protein (DUF302 family)